MSDLGCVADGCNNTGVIPVDPPTDPATYVCFEHAGVVIADGESAVEVPEVPAFHVDMTTRFAVMLLELAAVQMTDDADVVQGAYEALAANSGYQVDVCAGILLAMSMVTTLGAMTREDVLAMAASLQDHVVADDWEDPTPPPLADEVHPVTAGPGSDESDEAGMDADHAETCPTCDGTGERRNQDDEALTCPTCEGTGYLAEPVGPSIFDALAGLDDGPLDLPDPDPESAHATPTDGDSDE